MCDTRLTRPRRTRATPFKFLDRWIIYKGHYFNRDFYTAGTLCRTLDDWKRLLLELLVQI